MTNTARPSSQLSRRAFLAAALAAPATAFIAASPAVAAPAVRATEATANAAPAGFRFGTPLARAHAHNDYLHTHPLWDALAQGFTSVEADVWYRDGKLLLGHTLLGTLSQRGVEDWYLKPLAALVRQNNGEVYSGWGGTFQLLIDIKENGAESLRALEAMCARYRDVLARVENGVYVPGPIQVVYTGSRPFSTIAYSSVRYGAMDGHSGDVPAGVTPDVARMPLVSESWSMLGWQGFGTLPESQQATLNDFVARTHAAGARARFWGAPEAFASQRAAIWDAQLNAGVDLISTDHLAELRTHLIARGLA